MSQRLFVFGLEAKLAIIRQNTTKGNLVHAILEMDRI